MKNLCILLFSVVFGCAARSGQTNGCPKGWPAFAMHVQLRKLDAASKEAAPTGPSGSGGGLETKMGSAYAGEIARLPSSHLSAIAEPTPRDVRERDFELEVFHRLDRAGFFERPQRPSDSAVVRWAEGTFQPEVLRVGKTKVTCSLVTAIKRKNPLCLLNPTFFNLSW